VGNWVRPREHAYQAGQTMVERCEPKFSMESVATSVLKFIGLMIEYAAKYWLVTEAELQFGAIALKFK